MPTNTVIWLWVGNRPAIDPAPASNVTQTQLNGAGMPGYSVTGRQEIAPVSVTGTRTAVAGQPERVFTAPFNASGGFVSQFSFESPTTPGPVTGQTIQAAFRADVRITQPDGTVNTQVATILQMSNGDLFLRPNPNFLSGWDGIAPVQAITFTAVQPFPNNTVFNSIITFNPSIFDLPIVCFAADTLIATPEGPRRVQALRPGDRVLTADHGVQTIRWVGQRRLSAADLAARPEFRPVQIAPGALGGGVPERRLVVSPQHRVLVRSRIVARMTGTEEALIPAMALLGLPGIARADAGQGVTYVHFLCDRHEVVFAEGAPSETLLPGPMALRALGSAQAELLALFPELAAGPAPQPARDLLAGRVGCHLAMRHARNRKPLLAA